MTERDRLDTVEGILDGKLIRCDRCKQWVEGEIWDIGTSGVYKGWKKYMDPGEDVICEACMWSDPRYKKVFATDGGPSWKPDQMPGKHTRYLDK